VFHGSRIDFFFKERFGLAKFSSPRRAAGAIQRLAAEAAGGIRRPRDDPRATREALPEEEPAAAMRTNSARDFLLP
jgi:hypothetical protein